MRSTVITEVAETMQSVAKASEYLGQERAISAVLEQLAARGAEAAELKVFENAVRERLKVRVQG